MDRLTVHDLSELQAALARFGDDALYRGQVRHYGNLQAPAMSTSFSRQACEPENMQKWLHYASYALAALIGPPAQTDDLAFTQAVLQHYGWRSFFLDASSDPAVSAWFASHQFAGRQTVDMLEDCFESAVMLVWERASYGPTEDEGHLYVISKSRLAALGVKTVDLSAIATPGYLARYQAQSAWLVGPLQANLPIEAIAAHIRAPAAVFRAYAQGRHVASTDQLFPSAKDDPVLATLLDLPWNLIRLPGEPASPAGQLEFYRRTLTLPEYHDEGYRKILPSHYAFYRHESAAEVLEANGIFMQPVPEVAMYGHGTVTMQFAQITALLQAKRHVAFEVDTLIRLPEAGLSQVYSKGISVLLGEDGVIEVGDLIVEHPGRQLVGAGANMGWHYNADSFGVWTRVMRDDDCPCPNEWRHRHHLSALTIIEDHLNASS